MPSSKFIEEKKISKLKEGDKYLSYHILKAILQETDVPKKVIEEKNSELFYETLSGKGKIIFSNSMKYYGPVKNGLLETKDDNIKDKDKDKKKESCIILFSDGTKYEGEIHSNKISGEGKYYFPSGAKYSGHLLNGLRDGFGKYYSPEGVSYEGEWKGGLKEGHGTMKSESMTYEGEWKKGNIDGQGKIRWENGNMYEGEFKINHINGYGYMIWHNLLEKYIGKWKDDKQNGNGIHIWFESQGELKEMRNRYVGEWKDGKRNGYGVFFYSNGARYEGEWRNNLKTGFGIMIYEDGKKYIGRFEEDRLIDKDNELTEEQVDMLLEEFNKSKDKKSKEIKPVINNNNGNDKNNNDRKSIRLNSIKMGGGSKGSLFNVNSIQNNQKENKDENKNDNASNKENEINEENKKKKEKEKELKLKSHNKKKIYKYIPIFDISDLEYNYPEIKDDEEEITKVLLRNLSGINKLYNYLNKIAKVEVLNEETGKKNLIIRDDMIIKKDKETSRKRNDKSKSSIRASSKTLKKAKTINTIIPLNTNLAPKIEEVLRSDDIYFCIQLKDFWYHARENGLFNNEISISDFNRIFSQGKNNQFEAFQVPNSFTESHDIYEFIDNMIKQSKENFINKYKPYLEYYYREEEIPECMTIKETYNNSNRIIKSVHEKRKIILPRFFYECLIRLAFLTFQKSNNIEERNMKLSKKLEYVLDIIIPAKMKKKTGISGRTSISKLEQSLNVSVNVIDGNKQKIYEFKTIEEFLSLFNKDLEYLFDKLYKATHKNINHFYHGDKTVQHLLFYKKVVCTSSFLRNIIPNVLSYVEIISNFYKLKLSFIENLKKMKKDKFFDTINNLLLQDFTEYEFNEIIFLIVKKYITDKKKKLTFNEIKTVMNNFKEIFDGLIVSKELKKKYIYPKLKSHEIKEQQIIEEERRREEERKRKLERQRYLKERENFGKEDANVYVENDEEDEDDVNDSEDIFLD